MSTLALRTALAVVSCLASPLVLAHAGTDTAGHHTGLLAGLLHPFTGLDHLAAMLGVGVWSALTARRWWAAPAAFAALLLVGALLGMTGLTLPAAEAMIAVSVLVLGALLALRRGLPGWLGAAMAGGFAVFHGVTHGIELATQARPALALAGMLAGTLLLHGAGVLLGATLRSRSAAWPRTLGGGIALFGALLLGGLA